jgi:hypothetical protein
MYRLQNISADKTYSIGGQNETAYPEKFGIILKKGSHHFLIKKFLYFYVQYIDIYQCKHFRILKGHHHKWSIKPFSGHNHGHEHGHEHGHGQGYGQLTQVDGHINLFLFL